MPAAGSRGRLLVVVVGQDCGVIIDRVRRLVVGGVVVVVTGGTVVVVTVGAVVVVTVVTVVVVVEVGCAAASVSSLRTSAHLDGQLGPLPFGVALFEPAGAAAATPK